jgi:hypothetical protein
MSTFRLFKDRILANQDLLGGAHIFFEDWRNPIRDPNDCGLRIWPFLFDETRGVARRAGHVIDVVEDELTFPLLLTG